jgi:double-stranded uracil-DNA glycosylase
MRHDSSSSLPDLLRAGLDVVFVGINPSVYSVQQGHYFARPSNRFWPCLSRSVLSGPARAALAAERLEPRHDCLLLDHGIGFTDVVKRATTKASELKDGEVEAGSRRLVTKIKRYGPRVACFHGVTGYRPLHEALTGGKEPITLGEQPARIGSTHLYVVPNPSGANAHFTRDEQTAWYDQLARYLHELLTEYARR